jgi:hypothetical protein
MAVGWPVFDRRDVILEHNVMHHLLEFEPPKRDAIG